MNEHEHFKRFKSSHRQRMLTQVETPRLTKPNGNGHASAAEVLEDALGLPRPLSTWDRFLGKWENLTVAGREVKGWVVPQPLGIALILVMLGAVGYAYKSNTADNRETRDAVIRMETMLNERTKNFEREQDKAEAALKEEIRLGELQREQEVKRRLHLEVALKEKGIDVNLE